MKEHILPHNGKMTQAMVELVDGRVGIVDYRLLTKSNDTVMISIRNAKGKQEDFVPVKLNRIVSPKKTG
jgi:hypothetical protein